MVRLKLQPLRQAGFSAGTTRMLPLPTPPFLKGLFGFQMEGELSAASRHEHSCRGSRQEKPSPLPPTHPQHLLPEQPAPRSADAPPAPRRNLGFSSPGVPSLALSLPEAPEKGRGFARELSARQDTTTPTQDGADVAGS